MAVPNRPNAGGVVESAWGQVAHDTAVAQDVQSGTWSVPANGATVAVTFPRPFASAPAVAVALLSGSRNYMVNAGSLTATGFTVVVAQLSSTALPVVPTTALTGTWVAIGPRA